jgi:formate dehydrogenase iron-sulfur subunit
MIPKYEWNKTSPSVMKCKLCFERLELGKQTSCSEACQFGATTFGEKNDLIYEAKKRIAENPTEYIDYIYGIKEAGGTSVLYISKIPFEQLGFPTNISKDAIPNLSWAVLSKIPKFAVVTGVVLFGIHWITARRMEIHRMEQLEKEKRMK